MLSSRLCVYAVLTFLNAVRGIQQSTAGSPVQTRFEAVVNVGENETVMTTIPYDEGWTASIDDKPIRIRRVYSDRD